MSTRRKSRGAPNRRTLPAEVPETTKSDQPALEAEPPDADVLPEELRKMLEAAYT